MIPSKMTLGRMILGKTTLDILILGKTRLSIMMMLGKTTLGIMMLGKIRLGISKISTVSKAKSFPKRGETERFSTWVGLLALPANIRIGWRGNPPTNNLAY
jgi:hypothetical protein